MYLISEFSAESIFHTLSKANIYAFDFSLTLIDVDSVLTVGFVAFLRAVVQHFYIILNFN